MITLLIIGILFFIWKMTSFAIKATWGLTKGILTVLVLPVLVVAFAICGLVSLALPLLIIGVLVALVGCAIKK